MSNTSKALMRLTILLTATALIAACGSAEPTDTTVEADPTTTAAAATTTTTTAAVATTVPTTTTTTTAPLPDFPDQRTDLTHGGATWAVVLAGAETFDDPAITAAEQAAIDAGYTTGWTDCDEGAAEALGMTPGVVTLSIYFETEADAEGAAAAFAARGVDGVVGEVRTFCLD